MISFVPVFFGPFASFWMVEHMWHHNVVTDKAARYGKQSNPFIVKVYFSMMFFYPVFNINVGSFYCHFHQFSSICHAHGNSYIYASKSIGFSNLIDINFIT